jgi:3-oxoacyl-[acyl-carrier protein] reductase
MRFQDKVVIITGGAQGIGKEIATEFAKEKATVVLFDVNETVLEATKNELSVMTKVEVAKVNVTELANVEENINKVVDKLGRVDILVNNAGITRDNLMLRLSESDWDSVIAVNLKGTFNCAKIASRIMLKQRSGKIINISSVIGVMGNAGQVNYAASKAGVIV